MSFVSNLRMRNQFPVNSDLGSARIDLSGRDPMYEIIDAYNAQRQQEQQMQPMSGLRQVANAGVNKQPSMQPEPLQFGGVTGQSNPGADILARSSRDAERIYESYKKPLNEGIEPASPSNDERALDSYYRRRNAETTTKANADIASDRRRIAQQNADARGWKTVTVTDPNDPTKQVNYRHNEVTGETRAIELPGLITRMGSGKDMQAKIDADKLKQTQRGVIKQKAEDTLDRMTELLDVNDQLTPEAARAVGKSSVGNWIPTTMGYSGSFKIQRLASEQLLGLIGEMKAQSRTGATGFGQMNLKELAVLEKAASMLNTGLDEETFRQQLADIREKLRRVLMEPSGNNSEERIQVRNIATGQTGTVSASKFDPTKYERVQ
jgi:hypothetical protein